MVKTKNKILCIGACNIDYKFSAKEDIIRKTSNPVDSFMTYGGVIRNVGENLSRFNQDISLMTLVGNDVLGEKLIDDTKELMDVSFIDKKDHQSTGQYYAVMNIDGDMDVAYANMSIYDDMNDDWIKHHSKSMEVFDYIIADLNVQESGISTLLDFSINQSLPLTIIGVSGPKMKHLPKDIKGLDLLIVNKDESQAYFNVKKDSKILCGYWLNKGVKKVVITSGKDDVYFGDESGIYSLSVVKVAEDMIIDSTGAGDAFSAGVMLGLLDNKTLKESVVYGLVNASLTIQSEDSVRKDINELLFLKEVNEYESI